MNGKTNDEERWRKGDPRGGLLMLMKSLGQRGLWAAWSLCTIKVTAAHTSVRISAVIRVPCLASLATSDAQHLFA